MWKEYIPEIWDLDPEAGAQLRHINMESLRVDRRYVF
jgi:hypothetical protein